MEESDKPSAGLTRRGINPRTGAGPDGTLGRNEHAPQPGDRSADPGRGGLLVDLIGEDLLGEIVKTYQGLLETSTAVYERNGDYAVGVATARWCRLLDGSSGSTCDTTTGKRGLQLSGSRCRESGRRAAKACMERGRAADLECPGGMRVFAVPIRAGGEIVGSLALGYGGPPKDPQGLQEIAERYGLGVEELREAAESQKPLSPWAIETAKSRLLMAAGLIGAIVEHKLAGWALENRWARLSVTPRHLGEVFYVYDVRRRKILKMSPTYEQLWGQRPRGRYEDPATWMNAVHPGDRERVAGARCGNGLTGPACVDYRVVRPDRSTRLVRDCIFPLRDETGQPSVLVGIVRDLTPSEATEVNADRLREQGWQRERLIELGTIAARIVHDLGHPMAGLAIQTQLILRAAKTGETGEALVRPAEAIVSELRHLEKIVRDFRDFAGHQRLRRRTVDVRSFVLTLVNAWQLVAARSNVILDSEIADDVESISADEDKLRRALDNLVENALEAIGHGPGRVRIRAARVRTDVEVIRISVEDSGPGIPNGVDPLRLFDTTKPDGLGLGLPIAQQIVLAHGGSLELERLQPRGTAFHLYLPA